MNEAIVVSYDPFTLESRATIIHGDSSEQQVVSSNVEELSRRLVALAYQYNIYDIKTHAPLAVTTEVKRRIAEYENNVYSENKIQVEGI